jgi:hypothetical protein
VRTKGLKWIVAMGLGAMLAGCAGSAIKSSWKDPQHSLTSYQKIMVIAIANEDVVRRTFEDQCAQIWRSHGITVVPSYSAFPGTGKPDQATLVQYLTSQGIGAIMITQVKGTNTVVVQNPEVTTVTSNSPAYGGPGGGSYYGYYDNSYTEVHQAASTSEYTVATIESRLFDTSTQQNIGIVVTESVLQGNVTSQVQDLVKSITKALLAP